MDRLYYTYLIIKESLDYTGNVITCFLNNIQVQKEIISEVA